MGVWVWAARLSCEAERRSLEREVRQLDTVARQRDVAHLAIHVSSSSLSLISPLSFLCSLFSPVYPPPPLDSSLFFARSLVLSSFRFTDV